MMRFANSALFREAPQFAGPMDNLIRALRKLPGIGAKTAQRLAFHILRSSGEDAEELAESIREVKARLRLCSCCNNITEIDPCVYCSNAARNSRTVCVVEEAGNIAVIEKTHSYNGLYHVLHGALSPLNGVGPEQLRTSRLVERVHRGEIDEVILATNPTVEGEATAIYLAGLFRDMPVRVTRIATGVPAGSDIEYADEVTMTRALEGRREC